MMAGLQVGNRDVQMPVENQLCPEQADKSYDFVKNRRRRSVWWRWGSDVEIPGVAQAAQQHSLRERAPPCLG